MFPSLLDGDVVFYKKYSPKKTSFYIGDVVIFYHPIDKIRLIKRVKSITNQGIEVFGDNKIQSNDSGVFGLISKSNVIGIVTSKIGGQQIINFRKLSTHKKRSTFL